ncbi:Zn-dependent protease with chaperone function [Streptomyces canus]|uniref:Zn-dependent protease with chaperone function n=1 Tax=Streptomyces canus TaxID=58343 RepID=A0AAW8FIR4_9ACTN|nr:M56 family metallopeptidase [Streptomyces canus]MDQ0908920.1 Zn-dependent protease with chaperone function [Streptomyces canus]
MHYFVYVPLLCSLVASLGARPVSERLAPDLATRVLTASALVLAASSTAALGLLACAGLLRVPQLALAGRWSLRMVDRAGLDPDPVAVGSGLLVLVAVLAATRLLARWIATLRRAHVEAAGLPGDEDVVVVGTEVPEAFSVPGRPGRIVVSAGMLAALDQRERRVLIAHEHAHLTHRHHVHVALAHLAAVVNPLLRPLASAVEFTVERWADETAATATGSDRRLVARTVAKAALAVREAVGRNTPPFALGFAAPSEVPEPGPVPRRVAALLAPPLRGGIPLILVIAGIALLSLLSSAEATRDLLDLVEMARRAAAAS